MRCAAIFSMLIACSVVTEIRAAAIGNDCEPNGVVARAKEAFDAKAFWLQQLREIHAHVEGERTAYKLYQLENRRAAMTARMDEQELRIMGIQPSSDPELMRELAESERYLNALAWEQLQAAIAWGAKCTQHANRKLAALE